MVLLLIRQVLIIPLMVLVILLLVIPLMVLLVLLVGPDHSPDGSNPAKQNRTSRPDDQDGSGSGFIN